jgi:hypothetical protein
MTRYLFGAGVGLACVVAIYTAGQHQARKACAAAQIIADKERLDAIQDVAPSADLDAARERLCKNAGLTDCPL